MRPWLSLFAALFAGVAAANAAAAELRLEVEIPRMAVAEYHAPYLAFWLKHADSGEIVPLGLWYDNQDKWLKDLRLWWRRTGRAQSKPYDGLTGATRRPGIHSVDFSPLPALAELPAGDYELVVEAAREVGGREVVRLPFQWPATGNKTVRADGEQELGRVQLRLAP